MSEASVHYREAMKRKAHRLAHQGDERVDASDYHIPGEPTSSAQTWEKEQPDLVKARKNPVNPRKFKRGGHVEGKKAHHHGGRKSRQAGGPMAPGMNVPVNRFNLSPIPNRLGQSLGASGLKHGGKAHPDEPEDRALVDKMVKKECRTGAKEGGGKWIQGAIKHPGALHKQLGVPQGEKIPAKKLAKAAHSENPKLAKRARLAETLKGLHKASGGSADSDYDNDDKIPTRQAPDTHGADDDYSMPTRVTPGFDSRLPNRKKGGRLARGGMAEEVSGTRPTGGRIAKAHGGHTKGKGKTNIAIIIGAGHRPSDVPPASMTQGPARPPLPPPAPSAAPVPVPAASPMMGMPMAAPGMMPPGGAMPPQMPPRGPMPMRADGGRLVSPGKYPLKDGAGGGEGRLQKAKAYGL